MLSLGVSAFLSAQGPCFDLALGTDLALTDDSNSPPQNLGFPFTYNGVAYTQICVCSNGYIWLGGVAGVADYSPTEAELLTQAPRICPLWSDFNPGVVGSGHVYFNTPAPGIATVSYAGVFAYGTTTPVSFQVTLDATSSVSITYGAAAVPGTLNPSIIIGASPGVASVSNPVSFATRPLVITSDNFAEVIPATNGVPIAYGNFKMQWTPTAPGYIASDVTCTPNSLPVPATSTLVGIGCPAPAGPSMYQMFGTGQSAPDLSGLNLTMLPSGGADYIAVPNINPVWFPGFTNNLLLGDDIAVLQTLPFSFPYNGGLETSVYVSSNGFLTIGTTNPGSGCCTGNVAAMLAGAPRVSGWWEDLNPAAGGAVFADTDPVSGDFVVTWNGVFEFGTTSANTFQIALSPSGSITWRWQTVGGASGPYLAGYSRGTNTADPGQADLSAVNGAIVSSVVQRPLRIAAAAGSRPGVGTTFTVDASEIAPAPNGVFAILLISTEIPGGIPLDLLGLTGCTAYVQLPEIASFFNLTLGAPTASFATPIPADNSILGVSLMSQLVSDDLNANVFGYRVSNGLRWNFGI